MNKIGKILEKVIRASKKSREWRSFVYFLAAVVVFTTTYALILPAITVEKSKTDSVGGLVVEEADPGSMGAGAENPEDVHTVTAGNKKSDEAVQKETVPEETAGNTEAAEEEREPYNGEVLTIGDRYIMTLTGEEFDVVVSSDLSAGVSRGTTLSVRGIPDPDVAKSYSDRISDELLKSFVDTKSTEILYRLVFTDEDFFEYTPTGRFDVEFIFHNNTVGSDGEMIYAPRFDGGKVYAAIYDYLTDEMILAEKNGDEYETPVILLDENGVLRSITLKGLDFYEYSDVITLVGGPVNEELKLAAETAESSGKTKSEESSEEAKKSPEKKETGSGTLNARGSDYSVTLAYSAEAEIPDNAVLEVTEIGTGTDVYMQYLEQAKAALGLDKDQALPQEQARFFDIRIMVDGKEIQPAANVNVNIAYDAPVVGSDPRTDSQVDVSAVHFGKEGVEVVEVGDADDRSVKFEAESFSIYGVIYTVDFEYSVNGKMYQFSLPGGEKIALSDLIEVLGIIGDTNNGEKAAFNSVESFLKEVANVEFSDESLVKVTPMEGDWELEGLQPFNTEESLTITMKNGDVITVKVTDAQLSKDILTAKGETYSITVEYDDDAEIPENADLTVREISDGTKEFSRYLKEYSEEVGVDRDAVTFARFFDIEIVKDGKKIEPKSPVRVTITYKDALDISGDDHLTIIHFADEGTEVINETAISKDKKEITYEQDSFSVTGTIITNAPEDGKQYAVIVKKNNHYYSVRNDLSLELIDSAYDPANNTVNVDVKYPLLWNYTSVGDYHNLSIPSLGVEGSYWWGFAHDFYDRYFNVKSDKGYVEETSSQADLREYSAIWYENNRLYGYSGNNKRYIGVSQDGTNLIGNVTNENNAAEIYFARLAKVEAPADNSTHDNHMVDHIDISIAGETTVKLPLAYGDYYDSEGNKVFTSTAEHHVVSMTPAVDVTTEDIKKATIVAADKNTGEVLNDVFYITGYSQNEKTDEGGQKVPDQVRIEGSFKVSNIPNANDADNSPIICKDRRDNPILYTVTVTKTIPVEAALEDGTKLYIKEGNSYVPLVVEVPLSLSSSFDYWDDGNECPPLHEGYNKNAPFKQAWKDGKILYDSASGSLTGMDFQLIAFKEDDLHVTKPALEINKTIQKEDSEGNLTSLKTDDTHDVDVQVYYKEKGQSEEDDLIDVGCESAVESGALAQLTEGYNSIHHKTITVGKDAFGAAYDYDISHDGGLFYIKEDPDSIDRYVTGRDGKTYQYVSSRIETEYVWRTDGDENKTHFANGVASVPEVLGAYSYEGTNLNNGFLVFDIYNVYKEVETVDVPVDKTWYSSEDSSVQLTDGYTWTSTFVLEEMEVHESGPVSSEANTTVWREVDGVSPITISNGDSESDRTFAGLPKYRYYDVDGEQSVYRIMYSVDETAYELKQNGTTISKWDKNNGLIEGDIQYVPHWPHDAGDANDESGIGPDNPDFYHVIVENHKKDEKVIETLSDLKLQKQWEDGALEEAGVAETHAYATFQLKRYVTREHVSYDTQYYDGTDATVRLIGQDGNTDTLIVKKGAKVNIVATFNGSGEFRYYVDGGSSSCTVTRSWDGDPEITKTSSTSLTVTGDITIRSSRNWGDGSSITEDHLVLAAGAGSETAEDTEFSAEKHIYTLNRENGWIQVLGHLPLYSESAVVNGEQNLNHYSYYFTEIEMNPSGFYAEFTDGHGEPIGDSNHRVTEDDTTVKATNKKVPDFYVRKEWFDSKDPDNFPEIRFTLYQGVVGNDGKLNQGQVFVGDNGESYVDIPLNSDNGWSWKCPGYLPEKNASGQNVGYYVVESCTNAEQGKVVRLFENSELNPDGSISVAGEEITSTNQKQQSLILKYYNSNGDTAGWEGQEKPNSWKGGSTTNEDTLTIVNRSSKYIQFDVKKKWLYLSENGELKTETTSDYMQTNIFVKMELLRKTIKLDGTYGSESDTDDVVADWESYGQPFIIGYDTPGHPLVNDPNNFRMSGDGSWFFWISDSGQSQGLPAYGYYEQDDGTYIPVKYYYVTRELGVYSDIDGTTPWSTEYSWYGELLPQAWGADNRPVVFPAVIAQDQDRLVNVQASDLQVQKDWAETPDNVSEVYCKIWLKWADGELIDFTNLIAAQTDAFANVDYGFVSDKTRLQTLDNGVLVLGLTRDSSLVLINNVPVLTNKGQNEYYVEEVGYKDSDGNIYLNSVKEGETSTFFAEYDHWDSTTGEWVGSTGTASANKIKLTTKGNNKLRIKNQPTKDVEVEKKWIDSDGTVLDAPWTTDPAITSVKFKVKRNDGQYLTFGGNETLTIATNGQRAVVRTATKDSTAYTVTYVNDDTDKGDIGHWTTLVHGLQKYASNGTEYTYTIEELTDQNGKPVDGNGNTIQSCHTSVTGSEGEGYVIKNEKVDTSLAIEKTFGGSVELTEEQKQKITFTVTGKFDGTNETSRVFTYGKDGITVNGAQQQTDVYKWNDGILVIKGIQTGTYTVVEQNDDVGSIFEGDTSGKTYTHTSTCTVTNGTVTDGTASAMVAEGDRTTVRFVNTYNEGPTTISVTLKKVDKKNVNKTPLEASDLLDGAQFVIEKYKWLTPVESKDKEWNDAHKELNAGNKGVFTFTDLPVGIYKIVEKEYPNGYVHVTTDPIFEVVVDEDTGELRVQIINDSNGLVRLDDKNELIIIVGNEPGAALPNTGGPGTRLFTILGSILILGAGVLLWRRWRTI